MERVDGGAAIAAIVPQALGFWWDADAVLPAWARCLRLSVRLMNSAPVLAELLRRSRWVQEAKPTAATDVVMEAVTQSVELQLLLKVV
jgi:hypothetical protein